MPTPKRAAAAAPSFFAIEWRNPADLIPYTLNAKLHPGTQVDKIAGSIAEFKFDQPIVVDGDGVIIKGHGRREAALKLGMPAVPVIVRTDLTPAQVKAARLADNKVAESAWDIEALSAELAQLAELDVDLTLTGFDAAELEALLGGGLQEGGAGGGGDDGAIMPLSERFGVPPFTVLHVNNGAWSQRKRAWRALGIRAEEGREHLGSTVVHDAPDYMVRGPNQGGSLFDPVLAEMACRWFCPPGGHVLDPFAGEATKGCVAGALGLGYTGVELREEQVTANRRQWGEVRAAIARVAGRLRATAGGVARPWLDPERAKAPLWLCGDSARLLEHLPAGALYDFIWTSPPYYDLEVYSRSDKDGSAFESYPEFMEWYRGIFAQAVSRLNENRFLGVKIADVRDGRGAYYNFLGDNIACFRDLGLHFYNEAVLYTPLGSLPMRTSRQFRATRKMGRAHQNVLFFWKGDPRAVCEHFPADIEVGEVEDPGDPAA